MRVESGARNVAGVVVVVLGSLLVVGGVLFMIGAFHAKDVPLLSYFSQRGLPSPREVCSDSGGTFVSGQGCVHPGPAAYAQVTVQIESASLAQQYLGRQCAFGTTCDAYSSMAPQTLAGTADSSGHVELAAPSSWSAGSGAVYAECSYDPATGAGDLQPRPAAWWPVLFVFVDGRYFGILTTGYGVTCPAGSSQAQPSLPASPQWPQDVESSNASSYVTISIASPSSSTTTSQSSTQAQPVITTTEVTTTDAQGSATTSSRVVLLPATVADAFSRYADQLFGGSLAAVGAAALGVGLFLSSRRPAPRGRSPRRHP